MVVYYYYVCVVVVLSIFYWILHTLFDPWRMWTRWIWIHSKISIWKCVWLRAWSATFICVRHSHSSLWQRHRQHHLCHETFTTCSLIHVAFGANINIVYEFHRFDILSKIVGWIDVMRSSFFTTNSSISQIFFFHFSTGFNTLHLCFDSNESIDVQRSEQRDVIIKYKNDTNFSNWCDDDQSSSACDKIAQNDESYYQLSLL